MLAVITTSGIFSISFLGIQIWIHIPAAKQCNIWVPKQGEGSISTPLWSVQSTTGRHTHTHALTHPHPHPHTHLHAHTYTHAHIYPDCTSTPTPTHTPIHTHTHARKHTRSHARIVHARTFLTLMPAYFSPAACIWRRCVTICMCDGMYAHVCVCVCMCVCLCVCVWAFVCQKLQEEHILIPKISILFMEGHQCRLIHHVQRQTPFQQLQETGLFPA
jgi:hypothetical protein